MASDFSAEFDVDSLKAFERKVSALAKSKALNDAAVDLTHFGETRATGHTPEVTGHARRSTVSDIRRADKTVEGRYPYLNWLDSGRDGRGRIMKSMPKGYQIKSKTYNDVKAKVPAALARVGKAIGKVWG